MSTGYEVARPAVEAYLAARASLDASRDQLAALASDPSVSAFQAQMAVLQRQLATNPDQFRDLFLRDGVEQVAAGFAAERLEREFTALVRRSRT